MNDGSSRRLFHLIVLALVAAGLAGVALLALPSSSHHKRLRLGLDLRGGVQVVLKAVPPAGHVLTADDMDRSLLVMRNRIDKLGVAEPELRKQGTSSIVIQLAGIHDPATAAALIGRTAQLTVYEFEANLLAGPQPTLRSLLAGAHARRSPRGTVVVHCGRGDSSCPGVAGKPTRTWLYLLRNRPALTGDDLDYGSIDAGYDPHAHGYFVNAGFRSRSIGKFRRLTELEASRGRARGAIEHAAVVLDGQLEALPGLDYRQYPHGIRGSTGVLIEPLPTSRDAASLQFALQTGALPIAFEQIERTEVSATLGKDSLRQAARAAVYGLIVIAFFLLLVYRFLGLVAIVGLAVYGAFIYGAVLLLDVTVTLPGFAGLVLAVAVAADANVVVFERIKEEVRGGRPVPQAIRHGYTMGFHTIVDANVVTGITALVLFLVATALVKGFALLLLIGTLISIVTAIATTRSLLGLIGDLRLLERPSLVGAGGRNRFAGVELDFVRRRYVWFAVSGVVIAAGAVSLGLRGLNFGIDFRSGSQLTFATARPHSTDDVRRIARLVGSGGAEIQGRGPSTGGGYRSFEIRGRLLTPAQTRTLQQDLRDRLGARAFGAQSVSASFGRQLARVAIWAILGSLALIVLYIKWRFDFSFAVPVVLALLHDLVVTVGVYSLSHREVTSASVAAVLTVLGYSIYDTLIIFDRIRENAPRMRRAPYAEVVNVSLGQTVRRSLATTFITLLPVAALLLFGGATLGGFAFALIVGITSGAYSSLFVAAPLLSMLKTRQRRRTGPAADPSPEAVLSALAALGRVYAKEDQPSA